MLGPASRRDPALDQVRLRARRRAARSTRRESARSAGTAPSSAQALEASLRRLRHRPPRPLPAPQPAHGRDRRPTSASRRSRSCEPRARSRHYGVALGPAIGWREEGLRAISTRAIASVQTVYNLLEQDPGRDFMAAAAEHGVGVMARVPTSCGPARRQPDARDDLRPRRPPPPPAARVAGRGPRRRSSGSASSAARRPAARWPRRRSASSSPSRR